MVPRWFRYLFALTIIFFVLFYTVLPQAYADDKPNVLRFTSEEESYILSHKKLKVGYVQDRIPVSFINKNGEFDGISRYILDHISSLCGFEFEYVPLPTGDVTYDYLINENFDLVTSVEYNKENQSAHGILISNPYLISRKVVVEKENLDFRYDAELSVAISTGSQTLKKVFKETYPNFVLIDYDSISDCFDAVNSGEADLMIQNQYVVEYWLSKPIYEKLKVIPKIGLDDELCFSAVVAFGAGEAEEASKINGNILIGILNKAIGTMTEDEIGSYTIQAIMENQYSFTFSDFLYSYRYVAGILAAAFFIIIVLAVLLVRQRIRFAESKADAKAKGQFLSTMSHEIRTPLNGLIGLNSLMAQKLDDRERIADYIRQSSVTANYLLSLVNDILDTSKLQDKKIELDIHPVELELMIDTISSIVQNAMAEKKLKYKVYSEIICPCVFGDEMRIQQILLNLLDNARKFTSEGGNVTLSVKQKIISDDKVLTNFIVSDTGRGMSEEFQKHIFDLFAQERDTVSKGNQGTGLGLPISRKLAMLMDGDLTFVSQKGIGSSFTFTFTAQSAESPKKDEEPGGNSEKKRPKILVAEDNELNAEIIVELLRCEGFEVELAENGKEAFQMFEASDANTFSFILMDLMMPEMNGFESAKAIRSMDRPDAKTVRIFACTANSFSEERDKAFESGMNDFITKPIDMSELLKKLNE